ncbi:MAG: hypothetical protein N2V78_00620, partial [Methanophagales archaeon]|nr:hypothetical protein [Methanophagales archaeon]MCW7078963.1 hypothetical protein [Candidatus Methanoxibalbensis ujae]
NRQFFMFYQSSIELQKLSAKIIRVCSPKCSASPRTSHTCKPLSEMPKPTFEKGIFINKFKKEVKL